MRMFSKLYQWYKNDFDLEMLLWKNNKTYAKAYRDQLKEEEWF